MKTKNKNENKKCIVNKSLLFHIYIIIFYYKEGERSGAGGIYIHSVGSTMKLRKLKLQGP